MRQDVHEQLKIQGRKGLSEVICPSSHGISHSNDEGNILRAHALDLYLVFASRAHFEQSMEEFINSPNSTSENSEPMNMHAH
jgi:hypothetical protein